jgi:uncharacterized cupin superfamily protein
MPEKTKHVSELFAGFAKDAESNALKEPLGFSRDKLTVPEGEREAIYNLWAAPNAEADLPVWLAKPGTYEVDGADRPNFFEVTSLMAGRVTVEEDGHGTVEMKPGDTYVMRPGWTGRWIVTEYVEKAFVWVYI